MNTEINQFNLNAGILNKYKSLLHYNTYWHQIVVENVEGLDRDAVLKTLMRFCRPLHFIPVQYKSSKNTASFLLKNCGSAIQKLCSQNLIVVNPYNNDKPFKITIKLCYASSNDLKINIHINLTNVLNKRLIQGTGTLNLENFAKDTELEEYCALSQPKLFFYVMHLAKNLQFKILKLSNNDIESLNPMEALEGVKNPITIDLRNNNIKEIAELNYLKHLSVTELWLDGNPLCDNFDEITYGKSVKDHLEKLEKLDGVNVQFKGFLPYRRNFLCNLTGYDLVDQFLEHYFTLYDAQNRSLLAELYHKDALFSLTSMYIPLQTTSSTAKLNSYKKVSRNLKLMSDFSKTAQYLFIGPYRITETLASLPVTEHDPYSFTADLVMYTEESAVLVVCGVFRECSDSLLESDRLLGFARTFVLLANQNGEYSIINEMLNVTNATTTQATRAFKHVRSPRTPHIHIPQPQNYKEEQDVTLALKAITGLKTEWARKCLEECRYDMKDALTLFLDLFKKDKIPKSAFLSEQEKRNMLIQNRSKIAVLSTKNKQSIRESEYTVSPSMISPIENSQTIIKPRLVTPVGITQQVNRKRPITLPIRNKQTTTSLSQSKLSPDHLWNKFSSEQKNNVRDSIEVIDLASSPDEGPSHNYAYEWENAGSPGDALAFDSPIAEDLATRHLKLFGTSSRPLQLGPLLTTTGKATEQSASSSRLQKLGVTPLISRPGPVSLRAGDVQRSDPHLATSATMSNDGSAVKSTPESKRKKRKRKQKHLNSMCIYHGPDGPIVMTRREMLALRKGENKQLSEVL